MTVHLDAGPAARYFGSIAAPELPTELLLAVRWPTPGRSFYASRDGAATAGLGEAAVLATDGADRIERLADRAEELLARLIPLDADAVMPPLIGGFAFADGVARSVGPWVGWAAARMVLCEVSLVRRGASHHLVAVAPEGAGREAARSLVNERLDRALDGLLTAAALAGPSGEPGTPWGFVSDELAGGGAGSVRAFGVEGVAQGGGGAGGVAAGGGGGGALSEGGLSTHGAAPTAELGAPDRYEALVERALESIQAGELHKVTVARARRFGRVRRTAPVEVLRAFARQYGGCFRFWIEPAGAAPFAGASPERLVAQQGRTLRADALAGTVGRSEDPAADANLGALLLANNKERREHEAVVDFLRERLLPVADGADGIEADPTPGLLKVANVQHLHTPFTVRLSDAAAARGVLRHAATVHPTPAVAGVPADDARGFIARHEGLDRGWYAGGVGVVERGGDGEICVAIRSGVFETDALWLFAGAGIVAGSDPDREGREVEQKMRALRDLLVQG